MKRILPIFTAVFAMVLSVIPAYAADPPRLTVNSHYEVDETGRGVRATNTIVPVSAGEFSLSLPVSGVTDASLTLAGKSDPVEVTNEDGKALSFGSEINVTFFKFKLTQARPYTLTFKTDNLIKEAGKSIIFALPAQPVGDAKIESVELNVPTSRGLAVSYGMEASDTSIGSGRQTYRFSANESGVGRIVMLFGTATTANIKWQKKLENGSWWWRTVQFVLPPDTNQQTVFLKSVTPKPTHLGVDRDGNLAADYHIGPKKSVTVQAEATISLKSAGYNTTNTRTVADVPEQLSGYVSGKDSADTVVLDVIQSVYQEASDKIKNSGSALNQSQTISDMVEQLSKKGVPAREIDGLKLINSGEVTDTFVPGAWLEAFVPGIGWMSVDPFAGQYGQSDYAKIGLAIKSRISHPISSNLTDGIEANYSDEVIKEPDFTQTTVKLIKYPLLPGISLARLVIDMPSGSVLDGAAASGGGVQVALGSLAPLQTVNRWGVLAGSTFFSKGEVQFGRGGDNGIGEVLSTGQVSIGWLFALLEVLFITLVVGLIIKWRRTDSNVSIPALKNKPPEQDIDTEDLLKDRS